MKPNDLHLDQLAAIRPKLRLGEGQALDAAWRAAAREKLWQLLGMDQIAACDLDMQAEQAMDMGGYTRTRFTFQSEPDYRVPGYFLMPKQGAARVMVCLQGHSTGMHISIGEPKYEGDQKTIDGGRDFALQCIQHGLAALVIEQRGFGETSTKENGRTDCHKASMTALLMGRTMLAGRVWDVMRAIDIAQQHFSPGAQYHCMGNSGGGTTTMYAAALEPRITMAMPSCAVCGYDTSIAAIDHCVCNHVPGIRRWFDMGDLAGLIAPRPLVVVAGRDDDIFPIEDTKENFALIQQYYKAAGAPEQCQLYIGQGGHRFYPQAWEVFLMDNGQWTMDNATCNFAPN